MKTNKTFVLTGFNADNYDHTPLFRVMQERGFNIVRHHPEIDARNVRFLTYQNHRPTVVIGVMSDKDRENYFDIPAIHMSDFVNTTVRKGDHFLGSSFTLAQFDEIIYGLADEEEEEETTSHEDDDDDYAPVVFSSNGCGYYGYNEAFDML